MDEPVLLATTNQNANDVVFVKYNEVNLVSTSTASENAEIHVPAKTVCRKNRKVSKENDKKKTENVRKGRSKKVTQKKTEIVGDKTTATQSTDDTEETSNLSRKGRKRKSATKEMSKTAILQETKDETISVNRSPKNAEGNQNDNVKSPKRKSPKKEKSQAPDNSEESDDPNTVNRSAKNSKETKNDIIQNSKTKTLLHPPISEMVLESFKNLKKPHGITAEEINKYVDENYSVNINRVKPHIKKNLHKGVVEGLFDQVSRRGGDEKFKIRKAGKVIKATGKVKKTADKGAKRSKKVKAVRERNKKRTISVKRATRNVKGGKNVRPKKTRRLASRKRSK